MTSTTEAAPFPHEDADVETSSDGYAARFGGQVGAYFLDRQLRLTLELLAPWPGCRVLDVGGGHGQLAVPLVERGFEVTVVGSDPACEARLSRALPAGSYAFRAADLLALPFEAHTFDVVMAFRLLPHVTRWSRLIEELARVSRAAVIVDYPSVASANVVAERLFGLKKAVEGNTRPYRCFADEEVLGAFAAAGFGAPELRRQFTLPMVAHRLVRSATVSRGVESLAAGLGLTRRFGSPVIARVTRLS
ncbi:MAG: methyltransferase domain-containing protein [Vicinamibacterales bacterium]